jgi:hypothetical protein
MVSSERIVEFIREGFKEFGLSFEEFFSDYDEDTNEVVDYNLIQENGSIDPAAVAVASEVLGFREKDVYAAREKAIDRWFKKFPFFSHLGHYRYASYPRGLLPRTYRGFPRVRLPGTIDFPAYPSYPNQLVSR